MKEKVVLIILSIAINEKERVESTKLGVKTFIIKPLSQTAASDMISEIFKISLRSEAGLYR